MNLFLPDEKTNQNEKDKKLKKATFKMGDKTITYYINPSLKPIKVENSPFLQKKLAEANQTLLNSVLPPGLKRNLRVKPVK